MVVLPLYASMEYSRSVSVIHLILDHLLYIRVTRSSFCHPGRIV